MAHKSNAMFVELRKCFATSFG